MQCGTLTLVDWLFAQTLYAQLGIEWAVLAKSNVRNVNYAFEAIAKLATFGNQTRYGFASTQELRKRLLLVPSWRMASHHKQRRECLHEEWCRKLKMVLKSMVKLAMTRDQTRCRCALLASIQQTLVDCPFVESYILKLERMSRMFAWKVEREIEVNMKSVIDLAIVSLNSNMKSKCSLTSKTKTHSEDFTGVPPPLICELWLLSTGFYTNPEKQVKSGPKIGCALKSQIKLTV